MATESILGVDYPTAKNYINNVMNQQPNIPLQIGIQNLWEQNLFVDLTLRVKGRDFCVHKLIMASMSDYFQAMLTADMLESRQDTVSIDGIDAVIMEKLIAYVYTNKLDITVENAAEVLAGAMYLQMKSAIKICTEFMSNNLTTGNWYDVLKLFSSYGLEDGLQLVRNCVKLNIRTIVKRTKILDLPIEEVNFLLKNWQSSEYDLFRFIIDWVNADRIERKGHLDDLLQHVRFCLMTPTELAAVNEEIKEMSASSHLWCGLVSEAQEYHTLPMHLKVLYNSDQTQVRTAPTLTIFANLHCSRMGNFYDPLTNSFVESDVLRTPGQFGICCKELVINNFLVVCSFLWRSNPQVWHIFDPRTLKWERIANLYKDKVECAMVHDGRHMYAVGGEGQCHDIMIGIQQYSFETDTWKDFNMLPVLVKNFGACILDNRLYVCGGQYDHGFAIRNNIVANWEDPFALSSRLDCLDLCSGQWESKAPMLRAQEVPVADVMRIHGEEVICVFDAEFNLEYYSPTKNQWSRCTFTFNDRRPLRGEISDEQPFRRTQWARGNTLFLVGLSPERKNAIVTIPEEGLKANAEYFDECRDQHGEKFSLFAALSLAPCAT